MNLIVAYHQSADSDDDWSTPRGLANALEAQGVNVCHYTFSDPALIRLPLLQEMLDRSIDALLVCYAGPAPELDRQLLQLRFQIDLQHSQLKLICELGDEPQTRWCNTSRVQASHLSLSPDEPSVQHWKALGANCLWFTHWADTTIFQENQQVERSQFVVTTMGRRRYARRLSLILGQRFMNRHCIGAANRDFYSSGMVAFQYARWLEITRRIFEAAACGCCVLTNRLPEQVRLQELLPGEHAVVYYDGFWSLCTSLWRLYRDPALSRAIALEGQRCVLQSHTQHSRASQLLAALDLLSRGGTPL